MRSTVIMCSYFCVNKVIHLDFMFGYHVIDLVIFILLLNFILPALFMLNNFDERVKEYYVWWAWLQYC